MISTNWNTQQETLSLNWWKIWEHTASWCIHFISTGGWLCSCISCRTLRQLSTEVKSQRRVLTRHHGAARSPGAPAPPAVCSPGSFSLPGCAAPSCAGCAGLAFGSAAQTAAASWCWSRNTGGGLRLSFVFKLRARSKAFAHWQKKSRQQLSQTSKRWFISLLCDENVCNGSMGY